MGRRILWASLALAPATVAVDKLASPDKVVLFVLSAASLVPLAWLIGEATEHAAEHTGPGIGGFLNASFGNAPELIIALIAVSGNLPEVVRGSLAGSVVSNLLLVYGVTQIAGPDDEPIDRRSLFVQVALVGAAVLAFVAPAWLGYRGSPDRHTAVVASIPVAVVLLLVYLAVVGRNLRRHRASDRAAPELGAWPLAASLGVLAVATDGDGVRQRGARPLARRVRARGRAERVLHRRRDRRDRRQRGRARRRRRDRARREDAARDGDRDLLERAGRAARRAGRDAALALLRPPARALVPLDRARRDGRVGADRRGDGRRRPFPPLGGSGARRRLRGAVVAFVLAGDR